MRNDAAFRSVISKKPEFLISEKGSLLVKELVDEGGIP